MSESGYYLVKLLFLLFGIHNENNAIDSVLR